jgi:hypothetical protein
MIDLLKFSLEELLIIFSYIIFDKLISGLRKTLYGFFKLDNRRPILQLISDDFVVCY